MQTAGGIPRDWDKFVTMSPASHISFTLHEDDSRAYAVLKLINRGDCPILFKVKTTKPSRYLVRPSQGVIGTKNEEQVRVLFTKQLNSSVSLRRRRGSNYSASSSGAPNK